MWPVVPFVIPVVVVGTVVVTTGTVAVVVLTGGVTVGADTAKKSYKPPRDKIFVGAVLDC